MLLVEGRKNFQQSVDDVVLVRGRSQPELVERWQGKPPARTVRYDAPKGRITHRDNPATLFGIVS